MFHINEFKGKFSVEKVLHCFATAGMCAIIRP